MEKLKQGKCYIVKSFYDYPTIVFKYEILEVTETSYFIKDSDNGAKFRILISGFNNDYLVIEDLGNNILDDLKRDANISKYKTFPDKYPKSTNDYTNHESDINTDRIL